MNYCDIPDYLLPRNLSEHISAGHDMNEELRNWKNDRIFTGCNPCYPVELFIALIEGEAEFLHHDESRKSSNAWCLINPPSDFDKTPAGLWKSKMSKKYENQSSPIKWADLKTDLLDAFGRHNPYSVTDKLAFIQSLTKGEVESFRTFLLRIQWVLKIVNEDRDLDTWTKLFFILGLNKEHQDVMVDKLEDKTAVELCDVIKNPEYIDPVKGYPVKVELADEEESLENLKSIKNRAHCGAFSGDDIDDLNSEEDEVKTFKKRSTSETGAKKSRSNINPCPECSEVFSSKAQLVEHVKDHLKPYYCGICDVSLTSPQEWDEHEESFHLGPCGICSVTINDLASMRKHHSKDHGKMQTLCPNCKVNIRYRTVNNHKCKKKSAIPSVARGTESRSLRRDLRTHVLKEGEKPAGVRSMTSHIMGMANGRTVWYCAYCLDEFSKFKDLRLHTHSAHEGKKYRCDICFECKSNKLDTIVIHKVQMHDVVTETFQLAKCTYDGCSFKSVRESALTLHIKMAHSEGFSGSTCGVCGKRFPSPSNAKFHVETVHMKIKRFQCELCDEKFLHHQKMKEHMREFHAPGGPLPKGLKQVVCPQCGIKLRNEFTLRTHTKRMHEDGVKPRECSICGKILSCGSSLRQHIITMHKKDNHFPCSKCNRKFPSKNRQKMHYKMAHMNFKPFKCGVCGNPYVRSKDCAIHIATKHENWPKEKANKDWKGLIQTHPALIRNVEPEDDLQQS